MARIVAVHGIAQQVKGPETLRQDWLPALRDGLSVAGYPEPSSEDLACAFYGDLFRRGGKSVGDRPYVAADVTEEGEVELLCRWWSAAAETEPAVPGPDARTKLRTPNVVQRALNALSRSRFFAGLAERAMIGAVKQVHLYFTDSSVREKVRSRVAAEIGSDTRVVIGHSLGSVVAYEVLCQQGGRLPMFVTLGSPLAVRNLVFDRLEPTPDGGQGVWPGGVARWTNVADRGDLVALVKQLRSAFHPQIEDFTSHNGAKAHDACPYLTAEETGRAIAAGLAD